MDCRFVHASGQLLSRGPQAMILISVLGTSAALALEVSYGQSGIAADIFGFW